MKTIDGHNRGEYIAPIVTVDIISIRSMTDGSIGIAQYIRGRDPERGLTALPGAYVYRGDRLEDLARKTLQERCGVDSEHLRLMMAADDTERDSRGPSVSFVYLETGKFVNESYSSSPPEGFDHAQISERVMAEVAKTYPLTVMKELLPIKFTLRQAYELFKLLSRTDIDRANFINSHKDLWTGTGEKQSGAAGRPAELYSLTD